MGDAVAVDSRAIATTASRRQRHRSHEARRLWYGRIDAIDATARRIDSGHCLHQVGLSQTFLERSLMASEWRVAEKKATCRRRSRAVALAPLGSFSKIFKQVATCVEVKVISRRRRGRAGTGTATASSRYHEGDFHTGRKHHRSR